MTDEGLKRLRTHRTLNAVHIAGTTVSEEGLRQLRGTACRATRKLDCSASTALKGIACLKGCPLRSLGICGQYNDTIDDSFLESLKVFPTLASLCLVNTIVTERQAKLIGEIDTLKVLRIIQGGISERALEHLAKLSHLEELNTYSDTPWTVSDANLQRLAAFRD